MNPMVIKNFECVRVDTDEIEIVMTYVDGVQQAIRTTREGAEIIIGKLDMLLVDMATEPVEAKPVD